MCYSVLLFASFTAFDSNLTSYDSCYSREYARIRFDENVSGIRKADVPNRAFYAVGGIIWVFLNFPFCSFARHLRRRRLPFAVLLQLTQFSVYSAIISFADMHVAYASRNHRQRESDLKIGPVSRLVCTFVASSSYKKAPRPSCKVGSPTSSQLQTALLLLLSGEGLTANTLVVAARAATIESSCNYSRGYGRKKRGFHEQHLQDFLAYAVTVDTTTHFL